MECAKLLVEANEHLKKGGFEQAVGVLTDALGLGLNDEMKCIIYDQLAMCLMQLGRYRDALFFLESLASDEAYEFIDDVYGNLLNVYERLGYFRNIVDFVWEHKNKVIAADGQDAYSIEDYYKSLWMRFRAYKDSDIDWQRTYEPEMNPKISIIVPVYNTEPVFLEKMLESVGQQTYENWELCLADGNSESPEIRRIIAEFAQTDGRVNYVFLDENRGISENSNAAIEISTGDYLAFLDDDDLLAPNAIFEVAALINNRPDAGLIYSDSGRIGREGVPEGIYLNPAWSPVLLEQCNYIIHFVVVRRDLAYKAGLLNKKYDIAQDLDFLLKVSEHTDKIYSIAKILYYWRRYQKDDKRIMSISESDRDIDSHSLDCVVKSRVEHMDRTNIQYESGVFFEKSRFITPLKIIGNPRISVISFARAEGEAFDLKNAGYENVEILKAEAGAGYAEAYNLCAKRARGEYILFMSDRCRFATDNWLQEYLRASHYPRTGIVGAKVNYIDDRDNVYISSGRVFVGSNARVDDYYEPKKKIVYTSLNEDAYYYYNVSGLAPACLMIKRELFERAGGFDTCLPLTFFCLDLCLRVRDMGYFNIYMTAVEANYRQYEEIFYRDAREAFESELRHFKVKWKDALETNDPYLNPALSVDMFERYNCIFSFE